MNDEPPVSPLEQAVDESVCAHEKSVVLTYTVIYSRERRTYAVAQCSECSSYEIGQLF